MQENMTKPRVALVSGGMGGVGEAICMRMADAGYKVVTTYSPENSRHSEWMFSMKDRGYEIHAIACDVSCFVSCSKAMLNHQLHSIDILVNNAGITRDSTFKKMDKIHWDTVVRTNLDSVFNMTKQVIDGMLERNWGRIINISSVNGSKGAFGQSNYAASKAGMHGFTMSLAQEVARRGVTVNTVSPGYVDTKMLAPIPTDVMATKILPQIPVGRLGRPEEIAGLVLYLASEDAAFVTGANIAINGGQHMH